jgi:hypothetical protein
MDSSSLFLGSRYLPFGTPGREGLEQTTLSGAYASFLIRLWCEPVAEPSDPRGRWRAEVEHIQSGKLRAFDDIDQALRFVRQQTAGEQPAGQGLSQTRR